MTSKIKATVTYNNPVEVILVSKEGYYPDRVLFRSPEEEGKPGSYVGEHTKEFEEWFSGDQEIQVREIQVQPE